MFLNGLFGCVSYFIFPRCLSISCYQFGIMGGCRELDTVEKRMRRRARRTKYLARKRSEVVKVLADVSSGQAGSRPDVVRLGVTSVRGVMQSSLSMPPTLVTGDAMSGKTMFARQVMEMVSKRRDAVSPKIRRPIDQPTNNFLAENTPFDPRITRREHDFYHTQQLVPIRIQMSHFWLVMG
jgi:hypothetical protein